MHCTTFNLLHNYYLLAELEDSPVKMEFSDDVKPKAKTPDKTSPSPSKQKRLKQALKLKLESVLQKEQCELSRRRPVRMASRKNYYPKIVLVNVNVIISTKGSHAKSVHPKKPPIPLSSLFSYFKSHWWFRLGGLPIVSGPLFAL